MSFTRRSVLRALGVGGAASLLLAPFRRLARGGTPVPPRRLVVFFTQHGTVYPSWRMRPGGLTDDADWEFPLSGMGESEFSPILAPLHPLRDRMLVLDGLAMLSGLGDPTQLGNGHSMGQCHALTGAPMIHLGGEDLTAGGPSVDQVVADAIGRSTPYRSIELGVRWQYGESVIFQGANQRLPAEFLPTQAFQRLFGGGGSTQDPVELAQPSVLDLVAGEYDALAPRLGAADRARLEDHRDLVRDLEWRMRQRRDCSAPGAPPMTTDYETNADSMFRIASTALACDLARVVSIQMGELPKEMFGITDPAAILHNDYAHDTDDADRAVMTEYHRTHATLLAQFCEMLRQIPETSGNLLDHTLVVWANELATGNHSFDQWPIVMIGGAGGGVRPGRYLRWRRLHPTAHPHPEWPGVEDVVGVPHNKLLVSICRAMGLSDVTQFGSTSVSATTTGETVDLTGALDRIA